MFCHRRCSITKKYLLIVSPQNSGSARGHGVELQDRRRMVLGRSSPEEYTQKYFSKSS